MLPSDIELTKAEILDVEDTIVRTKKKDWYFLNESVAEMKNGLGTRWMKALQEDDAIGQLEILNEAILSYAKETGDYDKFIQQEKERIFEEHQDRLRRRVSNE